MTGSEAIAYIENYTWSTTRLGLERTRELLDKIGNPQKHLKFVHVTGSNGKGSTCAILDSVLRKAGYVTGLYTSPYICEFNERIQVNGENITDDELAAITEKVRLVADGMEDHPSQFELVTAIAMEYFRQRSCDIVVLEVGMGGALDSTNAIDAPEVAVFTNIGLEHTEYLGNTLEEIATTKGGIIKTGCDCVIYDGEEIVTSVLTDICKEKSVPYHLADFSDITPISHSLEGQKLIRKGLALTLPLLGEHQLHNLNVALTVLDVLRERGWNILEDAVCDGVACVKWPARFQVLSHNPLFILDGGHNPQCAEALSAILADYLSDTKLTFLIGVLADKDYNSMLKSVIPYAKRFVCVTPDSPRALDGNKLAGIIGDLGFEAVYRPSIPSAINTARSYGEPVVAFGSLYMSGAILEEFK